MTKEKEDTLISQKEAAAILGFKTNTGEITVHQGWHSQKI